MIQPYMSSLFLQCLLFITDNDVAIRQRYQSTAWTTIQQLHVGMICSQEKITQSHVKALTILFRYKCCPLTHARALNDDGQQLVGQIADCSNSSLLDTLSRLKMVA